MKKSFNITRNICNHFVGEQHTLNHRMVCGGIIMIIGVGFYKVMVYSNGYFILHFFGETIGYLIHGVGASPFVEWILKQAASGE